MAKFMDVHDGFFGVSGEQLAEAHQLDLAIQDDEGVVSAGLARLGLGKVFCLARDVEGGRDAHPRARRPPHATGLRDHGRGLR